MTTLRRGWMKRLGVALFLAAIAGAVGYVLYDARSQRTQHEQQQHEARQAAINRLSDFAKTTRSSADWESGASTRADRRSLDNMLMVDLERAWLSGRTILFVGAISDVSTIDDQTYRVFVEYRRE